MFSNENIFQNCRSCFARHRYRATQDPELVEKYNAIKNGEVILLLLDSEDELKELPSKYIVPIGETLPIPSETPPINSNKKTRKKAVSPQTKQGKKQRTSQRVVNKNLAAKENEELYLSVLLDNAKKEEKKLRELDAAATNAAEEEANRKEAAFKEKFCVKELVVVSN